MPAIALRPLPALRALLLATLLPLAAAAETPASNTPFPTLDAGMHTAPIIRFGVDRAGHYGVSASHDKTARVWDLHSGLPLRTLRVPVGPDDEGKLYAAAISPDGDTVAVGGWTGRPGEDESVYFFDRASGRLVGRIRGLPNVVNHLAWSPDGQTLALALGGLNGIRLHATRPPFAERARDGAYAAGSYSVDFAPDGRRLVSTSYDGKLCLYDAALHRLVPLRPLDGGSRPFFARFAPDSQRIAVGFDDSTALRLLSATDLSIQTAPYTSAARGGNLATVAWSADGRRLYAAGRNQAEGQHSIHVFDSASGRPRATWPVATSTLTDLQPLPDGRLLFATQEPSWGVVDGQGRVLQRHGPPIPDQRSDFEAFRLSAGGERVAFLHRTWQGGRWHSQPLQFDLRTLRLMRGEAPADAALRAPRRDGLAIDGWEDSPRPTLAGQPLALQDYEESRSLAIATDSRHFALGTEWFVRWFDADGRQQWKKAVPSTAWQVNTSADGRFVVAALGDGTLRWYRTSDSSEALALFVHADAERWVAWTPEGFFAASSPEAEKLFGYTLNQGRDRAAEFVSSAQLREQFYRPDLIGKRIEGDEAALAAAVAQVGDVRDILARALPPEIELLSDAEASVDDAYELKLKITPRAGGVGRVQLKLNNEEQESGRELPLGGLYSQRLRYTPGTYSLQVAVYNAEGKIASESRSVKLTVKGTAPPKPRLHVLAVGIGMQAYEDNKLATRGVEFADRDARAFAQRIATQAGNGRLYRAVTRRELTRRDETSLAAIEAALQAIPFEAGDTVVIYLAGHGRAVDGKYNFLPSTLAVENEDSIRKAAFTQERIEAQLRRFVNGRALLVLDTCHAGAMAEGRGLEETFAIDNLMRQSGRAVLAASRSDEQAFQDRQKRHGIFTLSLLDGLAAADYDKDEVVDVEELAKFLLRDVPARSQQANPKGPRQTPMRSPTPNAFPLVPVPGARK